MNATVKTRVTVDIEVEVGCFGDEWNLVSLKKDAKRAAETALAHLSTSGFRSGMTLTNVVMKGITVIFDDKE